MSTPIIDIRRPGQCVPRAAADARTASKWPARRAAPAQRVPASGSDAETRRPRCTSRPHLVQFSHVSSLRSRSAFTLNSSSRSVFAWIVTG
jgi:hypothetical protein